MSTFKWPAHDIVEEFKFQDDRATPNMAKVRQFQRHTEHMPECVEWVLNSIRNDQEQSARRLAHGTGATLN
jgi:hypothetical protein